MPPIPIARWSFVPRIAAEIDAVTSPSWISLMRAPATRISSIRSWWRGRSRTIVVTSPTLRPNAAAIASMFSATGRLRSILPRATGPTAIFRMYMSGRVGNEPLGPAAIIDIAPLPPRATMLTPSSGSRARSAGSPPAPIRAPAASSPASSEAPMTMCPSIGSCSRASCIPEPAGFLCALLVGPSEPSRAGQRGALCDARIALAEARPRDRGLALGLGLYSGELCHPTLCNLSAALSTSSITAWVAPSRSLFPITGTPSFSARSTM